MLWFLIAWAFAEPIPAEVDGVAVLADVRRYLGAYDLSGDVPVTLADGRVEARRFDEVDVVVDRAPDLRLLYGRQRLDAIDPATGRLSRSWVYRLALTDPDGTLRDVAFGELPGPYRRFHRLVGPAMAGVDHLVLAEGFRASCPGGSTYDVWAVVDGELRWLTAFGGSGEIGTVDAPGTFDSTALYAPFRAGDGLVWRRLPDGAVVDLDPAPTPDVLLRIRRHGTTWVEDDRVVDRVEGRTVQVIRP